MGAERPPAARRRAAFDAACAPVSTLTLDGLLPGAARRSIVGSGGPAFFDRFAAGSPEAADGAPNPLDRYTERVAAAAARDGARAAAACATPSTFPFDGAEPLIPFQRLGRAAGLGGPGPARAADSSHVRPLVGLPRAGGRRSRRCRRRRRPATAARAATRPASPPAPPRAVARAGFAVAACHARRLVAEPCRLSCAARIACIRGPEHRYRDEELAFHMAAPRCRRRPSHALTALGRLRVHTLARHGSA